MSALRTRRDLRTGLLRVELVATDAVERYLAALRIIKITVTTVVIQPQEAKQAQNQQAVEDNIEREISHRNHGEKFTGTGANAKGK